ncbi:MAG: 50S ribosomal protein L29 [Salibacteraceae bacterium]
MKPSVIAEMTNQELVETLEEHFLAFRKMKLNHAVSTLENPLELRAKRRVIARIKTELNKRQTQEKA